MVGRMQKRILAGILALLMVVGQTLTGVLTLTASAAGASLTGAIAGTKFAFTAEDIFGETPFCIYFFDIDPSVTLYVEDNVYNSSGEAYDATSGFYFLASAEGDYTFSAGQEGGSASLPRELTVSVHVSGANTAPTASAVSVGGTAKVGETLTGSYTYYDADSDAESGTAFKWYRASDASGTGAAAISGAEAKTSQLTNDDLGKYICFEVTPSDGADSGTAVKSGYTGPVAAAAPGNWADVANTAWYSASATSFIISTEAELAGFASIVNAGTDTFLGDTVTLAADLDLAGRQWVPIGNNVTAETIFEGTFDGGGHTISNLTIGTEDTPDTTIRYAGLFGYIQGVTIKDLGLVNVSIHVAYFDNMAGGTGGLAAIIDGYDSITNTVTNCYATGVVSGGGYNNSLGGLIGAAACCTMSGCYSTGSVLGGNNNARIGGLVGEVYTSGSITDCYSTCDVSAQGTQPYAGGLIGSCITSSISNCYAAGDVAVEAGSYVGGFFGYRDGGNMAHCYYNNSATQTSGGVAQTAKGVGVGTNDATGKTSVYMTSTDFVTDLNNGGTGAWISDTGLTNQGYPVLTAYPAAPDATAPTVTDTAVTSSNLTMTGMTLGWNKATDETSVQTALQYLVYQSSSNNLDTVTNIEANGTAIGDYAADIATRDVTGLTTGTTYYFNVIVKDEASNKSCYTTKSVMTQAVGLALGDAALSGGKYYYTNAEVSGSGIRTILIAFSDNVTSGDQIVLPAAPFGFTVSATSNNYTKRINLAEGTSTDAVQSYLRGVGFTVASAAQTVGITITTENITMDTFYNSGTEHYYQFLPADASGITWIDAYAAAKGMTYMGRTGYLATVMSLEEDTYLNSLSGGSTGWLGGTILSHGPLNGQYYDSFQTTSFVSDGWYWACGPEIGELFYNRTTLNGAPPLETVDVENTALGYYFNWGRGNEPNNTAGAENCLTTLRISTSGGKQGTLFSWNDIRYDSTSPSSEYSSKGYFVEYGNLLKGDDGSGSAAFASASDELILLSSDATLKATSTVKGETVNLGTPGATLGSETAGSVTLTPEQAADTSNAGSYTTLFEQNDTNAAVKVVKYASGASTANFGADPAYANEAIGSGDFFIVRVTAQNGATVNYYRINVMINVSLTISGAGIYTNGYPIIIAAGTSDTLLCYDEDADGEIDEGETPIILVGPAGNNVAGYDLRAYDIYGTAEWGSVASSKITMLGGQVSYLYGSGPVAGVNVMGNTDITMKGGTAFMLYGGGNYGSVNGSTNVTVTGGTIIGGMVGGCGAGTVFRDTNITITGGTIDGYICGGGYGGHVFGNTNVTITGGTVDNKVCGGGYNASVLGTATVTVGVDAGITGAVTSGCFIGGAVGAGSVVYEVAFYGESGGTKYGAESPYPPQWITEGNMATEPAADPVQTGMTFVGWKKVSDDSVYSFDSAVSAATKLYAGFLSADATLKASSTVKGETVNLGTPGATLGSETAGSVMLTPEQAMDTSNTGSYITLFEKNDANATVKAVKYASGASTENFASDTAYANERIDNGDFFIVKVTAQNGTTVNYYRINVMIDVSLTIIDKGIHTNGYPIIIAAGTSDTLLYYDEDADGEIDDGETPIILVGPAGNNVAGYDLRAYDIYGTAVRSSVTSSKITMLSGQVNYVFGSGQNTGVNVAGNTDIAVKGGTVAMLYGGGSGGSVGGSTNVTVTGGTVLLGIVCGGSSGTVSGDTNIAITGGTIGGNVYGGGGGGTIFGNANVTLTGGTINGNVYGGGWSGSVTGTATVMVGVDAGITGTVTSGCRNEGPTVGIGSKVIYEVAFYGESGGTKYGTESPYPPQWITEGNMATEPEAVPAQTGMTFVGWKKVSDDSVYSFDSAVSAATKLYAGFLSADATLKATSTVKGETVAALGTPGGTLGWGTAGSVMLTPEQAADTSNTGSYITLFEQNDTNAAVKVVKYARGASTDNFATDTAYANEAIGYGDFFIVRVTAQDGETVNYYKIRVAIAAEAELTDAIWKSGSTYTCGIEMSSSCSMVTISVDSGSFTVPSLGSSVLSFVGGTYGTDYISSYLAGQKFDSAVFSFTDVSAAEALLGDIVYSLNGGAKQTITATASSASPQPGDIYFAGHFYRYVAGSIDWVTAALAAVDTEDPYFGGRGYLATATSQAENSILLKLVDTGETGDDHWNDAWMGGLWQRNTGTVSSPIITRGTDGNEISYSDLSGAKTTEQQNLLQSYPILYSEDGICNGITSYIYEHPEAVLYYWIDGPEAGQEIANNVAGGFSPWHSGEPNCGDFVYIGWQGAYWDDLSAYNGGSFAKLSGYIVEFSGFGEGGSTEGIVASDTKILDADTAAPAVTDKAITSSDITRTGVTLGWNKAADDCSTQADLQYLVYRSSSDNLGTVMDIETNGTALGSYTADIATKAVTGLTAGSTYYFNVIVMDMAGNKTCYTTESITTLPPITAAITPAEALKEENLNTNSLTVALSNVTFTDETLDKANFTLNNAPTGVGIESVAYTDQTHCTVNLAYNGSDFDTDVTTFSLTIKIAELSDNDGDLTSNELTITALVETAPTVTTTGVATYTATTALLGGDVTASGGESVTEKGVVYSSVESMPEIGEPDVTKEDNGEGTGAFSETITGLAQGTTYYVRAYATNSEGTSYGAVEEFTTLIITSAITPASALEEETLDANSLTVALSNVTFADNVLDQANFTLNNAPTGVSIESVVYTDQTHCTVDLAYDGTDFDSDVTTFSLTIAVAELTEGEDLTSDELTITALVETAPTVTTTGVATYTATTALLGGDVTASGGESVTERGVVYSSVESMPEIGEPDVTKDDNGEGTGTFSETITGFAQGTTYYVRAYATNLEGTSYGEVEEFTTLTITSAITPASALEEENLDANSLTVALSNVTFTDETLDPAYFTLNNAPTGVSIESAVYTDATHCTVNLAYDDTDFDADVTTFSLTIAVEELTEGEDLTSDELTITALVEPMPTVTSVSPERGRILGGTSVTIRGANFTKVIAVRFGDLDAASYTIVSDTKITAVTPVGSAGTVHVTIVTKGGTSTENPDNRYTYARKNPTDSGPLDETETHAVTFRDWDGTVLKIQIVEDGKSASAPQVPEREGYTFTGWDKDFSEVTGNMTVTAKYIADFYVGGTYTVSFDSNGGGAVESQTIPYDGNVREPDDPAREGYTFGGWYTDGGLSQRYDFGSTVTGNRTLYAKWISDGEAVLPLEAEFAFAPGDTWECITENFTVSGISAEGVQITWTSSDPEVIRMEQSDDGMTGVVTRPQGHDANVIITVTAEGEHAVSRTFLLIVRQEGVSAEETHTETGRTAAVQAGNSAGSETIFRTALSDGTKIDSVVLTADTVHKLIEQGGASDSVVVTIGESADDPAGEYTFEAPADAVAALAQNGLGLTMETPAGTVALSAEEIGRAAQSGTPLYFRFMQAEDEAEEAKAAFLGDASVFSAPDRTGKVFGTPKRIETNLEDLTAAVTLPVKGLSEEQAADEAFLRTLGIYVEHGDGATEFEEGALVYADNVPAGIRVEINGFSRFQVVSVEKATAAEAESGGAPSPWIWIACSAVGLAVLVAVFLLAVRRKKESREDARS